MQSATFTKPVITGLALLAALLVPVGCGGGSGSSQTPSAEAQVKVLPSILKVQGESRATATDRQGNALPATFSVLEPGGGTVDADGRYRAPATAGTYHVQARTAGGAVVQAVVTVEGFRAGLQRQADLLSSRVNHTTSLLADGSVLVVGGGESSLAERYLPDTDVSSLVEIYDPASNQFRSAGTLLRPRSLHTATLLGDGTVLLAGGQTYGSGENSLATATVEAFDPATGQSRLAVSDVTTRYRHAAARLASGHVVLLGGSEGGGAIRIAERYD